MVLAVFFILPVSCIIPGGISTSPMVLVGFVRALRISTELMASSVVPTPSLIYCRMDGCIGMGVYIVSSITIMRGAHWGARAWVVGSVEFGVCTRLNGNSRRLRVRRGIWISMVCTHTLVSLHPSTWSLKWRAGDGVLGCCMGVRVLVIAGADLGVSVFCLRAVVKDARNVIIG